MTRTSTKTTTTKSTTSKRRTTQGTTRKTTAKKATAPKTTTKRATKAARDTADSDEGDGVQRGVLWDLDGTIVESTLLAFEATNEVLRNVGAEEVPWAAVRLSDM